MGAASSSWLLLPSIFGFEVARSQELEARSSVHKKAGLVSPAEIDLCKFLPTFESPLYITRARPSSSFCSTGMEQPDISTRPTASMAA